MSCAFGIRALLLLGFALAFLEVDLVVRRLLGGAVEVPLLSDVGTALFEIARVFRWLDFGATSFF